MGGGGDIQLQALHILRLIADAQKSSFDDDVLRCSLFDVEYGIASENCGARVPTNVRCAPRFLLSSHLLGPESRTFELSLVGLFKILDFDDDVASWKLIRRRILNASENCGAHVPRSYAALRVFYYRPSFLVLKAKHFKFQLEKGMLKSTTLMTR